MTFTATVSNGGLGAPTATGTVAFAVDSVPQASVPITGGTATFSTGSLTGGNHTITATYSGDTNNLGSTSAPLAQTVKANSTTVLTSSRNPSIVGQSVTFTATLTSLGGPTPTGTVQFAVDGVNQGGPVPVSGGTATFSTLTLTLGNHTVNAVYSGDGSNLTSNGFTTQTVNGVAPNITSANSTTFRVGIAGTFTVTTTGNPPSSLSEAEPCRPASPLLATGAAPLLCQERPLRALAAPMRLRSQPAMALCQTRFSSSR